MPATRTPARPRRPPLVTRATGALALLTLTALATACSLGGAGTGTAAAPGPVGPARGTVTWYAMPFGPPGLPQRMIAAFEKAHPAITVNYQVAPNSTDTVRTTLVTQILGGSSDVDVFNGDVVWPAQFGQAGLALPLDRYLPAGYWKRFPARRAAGTRYRGAHLAAPFFTDEGFLVYRKDLLRAAHLPVPTTWEQLTSEARRLQRAHRVKYGYAGQFAGYEGLTCNWMEFATDAGATVLNPAGTRATVDSPAAARALRFMRSLITSGVSPRAMTTFQEQQAQQLFTAGQSAFLRNWGYAYDDANNPATSHVVGKVGIARLPGFAGRRAPGYATIGGWNLMINPHSRHLGADLAFVKWMTGGTAQRMLAAASEIPAVSSVLDDPAVTAASPVLRTAAHNVLVSRPSGTPAYAEVSLSLYTNLNAALSGSRTPGPALAAAARGINTALGPGGL